MLIGLVGGGLFIFFIYDVFPASDSFDNGLFDSSNYQHFALIISTLMFVWMTFSTVATLNQVKYLPQPASEVPTIAPKEMLFRIIEALKNTYFRVLFIATLVASAVLGTGQVFDTYMNTFFWGFGPTELKWFSLAILGMLLTILTIRPLQARFEKRDLVLFAIVSVSVLQVLKVSLRFAGWLPDNGDPWLLQILVLHALVTGYFVSLTLMMFASMMADIADHQELQNGLR